MAGREARDIMPVKASANSLACNGSVDIHGRIADKISTGGWRSGPFIIVNEVVERMAFFAVGINMVPFLVRQMHTPLPDATTDVGNWIGAAFVLTIFGAFIADAYIGRFLTILIFSCIYAAGMILLTLTAELSSLHPPPCAPRSPACEHATEKQRAFLISALGLIALGTGGIKPCISSFGADQFDESDPKEARMKQSFFDWFFFAINLGAMLGLTLLQYVIVRNGWGWGFGVPAAATVISVLVLAAGAHLYRYQKPRGSPFTRFLQVLVAACRNHAKGVEVRSAVELYEVETKESAIHGARKLPHTNQYSFLDKAAVVAAVPVDRNTATVNTWRLCTVTQVEEFKSFIGVLPVWLSTLAIAISYSQMSTFFVSQAGFTDLRLAPHFVVPQGSIAVFAAVTPILVIPLYETFIISFLRRFTGNPRGITTLQRIGVGFIISILALACAAFVEHGRRTSANPSSVKFWCLLPQYFLLGIAEVFAYVGQMEFFYDEATDGTRSISSAMYLSEVGIGSWLNTALVKIVVSATGGKEKGWLRDNLNKSRLDYYYWLVCGINVLSFCVYLVVAMHYKGSSRSQVMSDTEEESVIQSIKEGSEEGDTMKECY